MRKYKAVEVSEKELEELVRKNPDLIEEGLRYVDHQVRTERGPLDVLLVDSGNALVVAELKVTEDDGMLVQGIDYFDYVARNIEAFARAYKEKGIDPTQEPRLFLIAPSLSSALLARCKWIDISLSLFSYKCLLFNDGNNDIVPVFSEVVFPSRLEPVEIPTIEKHLHYITEGAVRMIASQFLEELQQWDKDNILIEAIKYEISIKVSGRVFMTLSTQRKRFLVWTYDDEGEWTRFPIQQDEDLNEIKPLLKSNYEKFRKKG